MMRFQTKGDLKNFDRYDFIKFLLKAGFTKQKVKRFINKYLNGANKSKLGVYEGMIENKKNGERYTNRNCGKLLGHLPDSANADDGFTYCPFYHKREINLETILKSYPGVTQDDCESISYIIGNSPKENAQAACAHFANVLRGEKYKDNTTGQRRGWNYKVNQIYKPLQFSKLIMDELEESNSTK